MSCALPLQERQQPFHSVVVGQPARPAPLDRRLSLVRQSALQPGPAQVPLLSFGRLEVSPSFSLVRQEGSRISVPCWGTLIPVCHCFCRGAALQKAVDLRSRLRLRVFSSGAVGVTAPLPCTYLGGLYAQRSEYGSRTSSRVKCAMMCGSPRLCSSTSFIFFSDFTPALLLPVTATPGCQYIAAARKGGSRGPSVDRADIATDVMHHDASNPSSVVEQAVGDPLTGTNTRERSLAASSLVAVDVVMCL